MGPATDGATLVPHTERGGAAFDPGREDFLAEARRLAKFDPPNIVRVRNFVEANGTGYLVMDYYEGRSPEAYLRTQPGERVAERLAVQIIMPVLDGLRAVHGAGLLHRDIKQDNIYLTHDKRVILIDFGAARQAGSDRSRSVIGGATPPRSSITDAATRVRGRTSTPAPPRSTGEHWRSTKW